MGWETGWLPLPAWNHLPGKHDQKSHGRKGAGGKGAAASKPAAKPAAAKPAGKASKGKPDGGKPFSDVEGAEDHFAKSYKTNLKQGKVSDQEFLRMAAAADGEMSRMSGEFKAVKDTIKKRARSQDLELGRDFGNSTAGNYRYGEGIEIGKGVAVDSRAAPSYGGHTVGSDFGSVFRHELGHEVYNVGFSNARRQDWGTVAEQYLGTSTISRYGGTNASELFSEAFSAYSSPNYRRGGLPADVERWLDTNVRG